ncbi:hypothetical protein MSP8887_00068 [Marinomonas spartinae]|nr:hypothetical protein MSP8887_00068 [Marinomonas spartinae]
MLNHTKIFPIIVPVQQEGIYALELSFNSKSLRNICENSNELANLFKDDSNRLKNRISDLLSFNNMAEFTQIFIKRVEKVKAGNTEMYQVNFGKNNYILIEASHIKNPTDDHGCIDWKSVNRIKIVSIGEIK